ncbi:MAG: glycosyltransferase family 2 protein [Thermodesulfobacteriota bacterium]
MPPFFSVIIPTYNRKDFLKTSVDSVLNQTFQDFEIIIVDDGSTDHTVTLLTDYRGKGINYIFASHHGVSHARNSGIRISRGNYIAFLDSDDRWDERKLEIMLQYIEEFPEISIFHTEEIWYRKGKILKQKEKHKKYDGYIYQNCLPLCSIGMSTSVVKLSLFEKIGYFDESLPACEDYDLWLRSCLNNKVKLIPQALTIKEGGREDQLSNQQGLDKYRIYSLEKMLNSGQLNSLQRQETYNELINKCRIYANGAIKRGKMDEADIYSDKIKKYNKHQITGEK